MRSVNFEFIRQEWPELADLAGLAEQYAHADPASALVKLRLYGESMVSFIYHHFRLQRLPAASFVDLLGSHHFKATVPSVILTKFHTLRVQGNRAAHGDRCQSSMALGVLEEAFDLARWLVKAVRGRTVSDTFQPPVSLKNASGVQLGADNLELQNRLKSVEETLQRLLTEVEESRAKTQAAQASEAELRAILQKNQEAASALDLDEQKTRRRMIDELLREVGWDVGPNGASTDRVGQEVSVPGEGRADYVLYDERHRPIGVIEAKRAASDPQIGLTQGQLYADGLEKEFALRPVIFATNGFDILMWNDRSKTPEVSRSMAKFYSPESLEYVHFQREQQKPLSKISAREDIIPGRPYQHRAFRKVLTHFDTGHRKALLVLATGTGKTRVVVSIAEALIRAGWARRVLFLCDRVELRNQAAERFNQFLPNQPQVIISSRTREEKGGGIYFSTYPAMDKHYLSLDPGFFDLLIIDEAHRSVFAQYKMLLDYFDCRQLGLTATPLDPSNSEDRDTFLMFGCDTFEATDSYDYEEAVFNKHLVPMEVKTFEPKYHRDGVRYSQMSESERRQLDEQVPDPTVFEYDREQVDREVFDLESNRMILRNLMENGIRDATGSRIGKSIIFARSARHAELLHGLFEEMFEELGGDFCKVIYHEDPRAGELITRFKDPASGLVLAISIDMLDTGIDVPEIVNLVFAKPVYSKVKFLQMIGRGTRTCPDLFGLGEHKQGFTIFDHWQNFEFFATAYKPPTSKPIKSAMESLFEARIDLAEESLRRNHREGFDHAILLIKADIASLPRKSWFIRQQGQMLARIEQDGALQAFCPETVQILRRQVAPLMRWRPVGSDTPAYRFDELMTRIQTDLIAGSSRIADGRARLETQVSQLPINLNPVRAKQTTMDRVRTPDFWTQPTLQDLEEVRTELRGIMRHRDILRPGPGIPVEIDIRHQSAESVTRGDHDVQVGELQKAAFLGKIRKVLNLLMPTSSTLQRISRCESVTEEELAALVGEVRIQSPEVDLGTLPYGLSELGDSLASRIRGILGERIAAIENRFSAFLASYPHDNQQVRFLDLLQHHLRLYGALPVERLWEEPFTRIHPDGVEGVFRDPTQQNELLDLVRSFSASGEESK